MLDPLAIVAILLLYITVLFGVAVIAERQTRRGGKGWATSPIVYSLSMAVYCTSWTYYGSVGNVTESGLLYMTIHLGPTLGTLLYWPILRKMVRIKSTHRITSIADFVSARYGRSQTLAAVATLGALVGSLPYIALQLRAIISTFEIITTPATDSLTRGVIRGNLGPLVVVLMSVFTIVFGVRRVDPTERHHGIVTAVAFESIVKLLAFLAVGLFVTFNVFSGPSDVLATLQTTEYERYIAIAGEHGAGYLSWTTYLLLATSAVFFCRDNFTSR